MIYTICIWIILLDDGDMDAADCLSLVRLLMMSDENYLSLKDLHIHNKDGRFRLIFFFIFVEI